MSVYIKSGYHYNGKVHSPEAKILQCASVWVKRKRISDFVVVVVVVNNLLPNKLKLLKSMEIRLISMLVFWNLRWVTTFYL